MDNLDKLDFLYKEIEYAKTQLKPHDTGHISTAISWMKERVRDLKKKPNLGEQVERLCGGIGRHNGLKIRRH